MNSTDKQFTENSNTSSWKSNLLKTAALFNNKRQEIFHSYILPYKWEYFFGGIFILLILFSELYFDFFATYRAALSFWYALFEGHPLSFYSYAKFIPGATLNRMIADGAGYDFTIYAFFAIWNFPAWLYEKLSGNYAESCFLCLAWAKLMLPTFVIMTARGMKKILEFIIGNDRDSATMVYAYSFSGILIVSVYLIGQYDIICALFCVYGLYYFLTKDYRRFYLFFGVALTCKNFAVFVFICLILLHEKRFLYIIRNFIGGCYLVIIEKLLFSFGKSYESIHSVSLTTNKAEITPITLVTYHFKNILHLKTYMGNGVMSTLLFLFALIWIYCYLQKREETRHFYYKVIYIAFCINLVFVLYAASHLYWFILLLPYMILMIYIRSDNRKINLLLETVGTGSLIVWRFSFDPHFFTSNNFDSMLIYHLLGKPYYYQEGIFAAIGAMSAEGGSLFSPFNLIRSIFYICMLLLLIINFPAFVKESSFTDSPEEVGIRGLLTFRTVCVIGVLLLPLIAYTTQVIFHDSLSNFQTGNQLLNEIIPYLLR